MYQELIQHTWELRGERCANATRDIIRVLTTEDASEAVLDAGAYYHLYTGSNSPEITLARYNLSDEVMAMLKELQCGGLQSNATPGAWQNNIRRFYYHTREDIIGNRDLEMVQAAISETRVANYHCKSNYGKGLTFIAAELLYVQMFKYPELAERVYRAIRRKADAIGFRRADVEARAFQVQGYIYGLYKEIYHTNPRPANFVKMPASWVYHIDSKVVSNA